MFGTFLALLLPIVSLAQGTVRMSNNFTVPGARRKTIIGFDSGPLSKEFGRVEVLDSAGQRIVTGGLIDEGIFSLGVIEVPNAPIGGAGTIVIRAWDSRYGATYEEAQLYGGRWGWVTVTLQGLGGGTIPPPTLSEAGDFRGLFNGRLTNGLWNSPVELNSDGSLRIQSSSFLDTALQLWTSTDLTNWSEVLPMQLVVSTNGPSLTGWTEWNLKPDVDISFYSVTPWWGYPGDTFWCCNRR
jgi:hypothetical protein